MTLDGFITFLGLIAAALAIMSPITRLQLAMARRRLALWSAVFTLAVLYFEFFDGLGLGCPPWIGSYCPVLSREGPITPQQAAFLVTLVWLVLLGEAWLRPRLTIGSLPALRKLVDRFAESHRYGDLVDIVDHAVTLADDCSAGTLPYQTRRDRWTGSAKPVPRPLLPGCDPDAPGSSPERPGVITRSRIRTIRLLMQVLPSDAAAREAADGILATILTRPAVVDWIAQNRPRFGAQLLLLQSRHVAGFSDQFIGWLIAHPGSALYDEVRRNVNLDRCGYRISDQNALLWSLLSDVTVVERLEVYQPVGEHVLAILHKSGDPDYVKSLNRAYDRHWDEKGVWRDQTFIALRFFDIMVQAAACQNIAWHMWLFYMHHVIEQLEKDYDETEGSDIFGEYPTRAARLMCMALENLADWVELAAKVGRGNRHGAPVVAGLDAENDNIPKSAAIAIGIALGSIIPSTQLGERMKRELLGRALAPLRRRAMRRGHDGLRAVLIEAIIKGGYSSGPPYLEKLRDIYAGLEERYHDELDDFQKALDQAEP